MREDEWLKARLHKFVSDGTTSDLKFYHYRNNGLEIEGIEFQPLHIVKHHQGLELGYEKLVKSAEASLVYRSIEEMNALLRKGFLLNDRSTWFSINDKGEHSVLISVGQFSIPNNLANVFENDSRFPFYYRGYDIKKIRVRTQLLSPNITYTVNLVFKYKNDEITQNLLTEKIKYKLYEEEEDFYSCVAYKREDDWWAVELYQFTSDETLVDLQIVFQNLTSKIIAEGIEFRPLEKVEEPQVSHDMKEVDMKPPISVSDDTYWEQKLPNDYQDIIKWSKDINVELTTNKELYSILRKGFPVNNGREWLSLDKNGKKCLMLSARVTCKLDPIEDFSWQSLPESDYRFGEALMARYFLWNSNILNINTSKVLSPQTKYGCFIVYKLLEGKTRFVAMKVRDRDLGSDYWYESEFWYVSFVS